MTSTPRTSGLTLSIVSVDEPRVFCRRIAAAVATSPVELTRAFAVAKQAYPPHEEAVSGLATVMHCEFRLRDAHESLDAPTVASVLEVLAGFETFGLRLLDEPADSPVLVGAALTVG
jgi:hypothetical protein